MTHFQHYLQQGDGVREAPFWLPLRRVLEPSLALGFLATGVFLSGQWIEEEAVGLGALGETTSPLLGLNGHGEVGAGKTGEGWGCRAGRQRRGPDSPLFGGNA